MHAGPCRLACGVLTTCLQLEERLLLLESAPKNGCRGGDGTLPDQGAIETALGQLAESMQAKLARIKKEVEDLAVASEHASARHADLRKDVMEQLDECKKLHSDHVTQVDRKLKETHTALRLECAPRTPLGGGQGPMITAEASEDQHRLQQEVGRLSDSLSELKKVVAKESLSLATNIKHTSKILMDMSDMKSKDEAKSRQFAHKSELKALAQKSELTPIESVGNMFLRASRTFTFAYGRTQSGSAHAQAAMRILINTYPGAAERPLRRFAAVPRPTLHD